jgi:hypothetical protein
MGRNQLRRWYREQRIADTDGVVVIPMRGLAASFNLADPQVRAGWAALFRELSVAWSLRAARPSPHASGGRLRAHELFNFKERGFSTCAVSRRCQPKTAGHLGARGVAQLQVAPDDTTTGVRPSDPRTKARRHARRWFRGGAPSPAGEKSSPTLRGAHSGPRAAASQLLLAAPPRPHVAWHSRGGDGPLTVGRSITR